MPSLRVASAALAVLSFAPSALCDCESFGLDFQSGGTYFQNSLSSDPFTALQEFEGCQNDTAHNVFVDPAGDQSECSQTPLTPDDTPQLVNCTQWPKSSLYTGDWSLLIISNNGDGDPIAYERDFSLTVGPQQTTTVTPTVTVSDISTPVVSTTTTTTSTIFSTLDLATTTAKLTGAGATVTIQPKASTSRVTKAVLTLTQQVQTWDVQSTTKTVPASCVTQATGPSRVQDPIASIVPTILGDLDNVVEGIVNDVFGGLIGTKGLLANILKERSAQATPIPASAKFKRAIIEGRTPSAELKRAFVEERHVRLTQQLNKRAPDEPIVTVTDVDDIQTTTISSEAPTTTAVITSTVFATSTITPAPITVGQIQTITASASTRLVTIWVPLTQVTKTSTRTMTITNNVTTTSAGAAESCAAEGGYIL